MRRALDRMLRPVRRRLAVMVTRAVVHLVNDATQMQELQVTAFADETLDGVERFQQYGFTSTPHPGAEAVALAVGGHRAHTIVLAVDDRRYRLKELADGEVAIYTDEGDAVHLKRGGEIALIAATKVRMDTPLLEVTGEILDLADSGGVSMSSMRGTYNAHTHPENDDGGPTSAPNEQM